MGASLPLVGAGEPVGEPERQLPLLRLHQPDELNPANIYITSLRIQEHRRNSSILEAIDFIGGGIHFVFVRRPDILHIYFFFGAESFE